MGRARFPLPSSAALRFCALCVAGSLCAGCGESLCDILSTPSSDPIITTDRYQLSRFPGAVGSAALRVIPMGGRAPYSYEWSARDASGRSINGLLSSRFEVATRIVPVGFDGPCEVSCRVTDACGTERTDRRLLRVGGDVGLDILTQRHGVRAGGGPSGKTTIRLNPRIGLGPFSVEWTCTLPDGNVGNERLDTSDPLAAVFTSSGFVGTHIVTARAVDSAGAVFVRSAVVMVDDSSRLDVTAARASVEPGGGSAGLVRLSATPIGGREPYSYDWEIIASDGTQRREWLWDTRVRSPVFESGDEVGLVVARCAVTDSLGTVLIGSTTIDVRSGISVDVGVDRLALVLGDAEDTVVLSAETRGGREPVVLDWEVIGPDGEDDSGLVTTNDSGETVFEHDGRVGSYLVRCRATDAGRASDADAVVLTVGGSLGVLLRTDKPSVTVGGPASTRTARLLVEAYGGTPPYGYLWSVINPRGQSVSGLLSGISIINPSFLGSTLVGPFTVICEVRDSGGRVAVDSTRIVVGQPINADVLRDGRVVGSSGGVSGQTQLFATTRGGSPPYAYEWMVTDEQGLSQSFRLSDTDVPNPVFDGVGRDGVYRVTLAATDALDATFVETMEVVVGVRSDSTAAGFSLDVATDRQLVPPSEGRAHLTTTTVGGAAPLSYAWFVTGPDGNPDNERLDVSDASASTFSAGEQLGTYRVRCVATDAVGRVAVDSLQLTVTDEFNLDVRADVTHVGPGGVVALVADRNGGMPDITFAWTVVDESGRLAGSFTTDATRTGSAVQVSGDDVSNSWVAPTGSDVSGAYRITVVATDADGVGFTDSVIVNVTNAFVVELSSATTHVGPGDPVQISVDRTGGTAAFTYTWSAVDPDGQLAGTFATGSTGAGSAIQEALDDTTNTWTSPVSGGGALGLYTISLTGVDASGATFTDSVSVSVADAFSINLAAGNPLIASGASVMVTADRFGGEGPFSYQWVARDSGGSLVGTFTSSPTGVGSASQTGVTDDGVNTWIAPTTASGVRETYTITTTASDRFGSVFTDSVQLVVGPDDSITMDVTAVMATTQPGGTVTLAARVSGGTGNINYAWSVFDDGGVSAGTLAEANQLSVPGNTTNTWTAPSSATGVLGTYRVQVVATDANGSTFTDSVQVFVASALSLDVTANNTHVVPGATVTLTADHTGGEPDYTYSWTARNSAGTLSGSFVSGATATGAATQTGTGTDVTNTWSASVEGTYTLTCLVTDGDGQTFTDSVSVVVTANDVFSLNVTGDKHLVAPGETVSLVGDVTGGRSTYSYAWSAVNSAGTAAGALTAATQSAVAGDTTNSWVAPGTDGSNGTYRISTTATDSDGRAFTDSIVVEVSSLAVQNIFLAPMAGTISDVLAATLISVTAAGADPGQQITAGFTNPPDPRNVVITIIDANNSVTGGMARVTGLDPRGLAQSEVITIAASGGGSSTNTGVSPFAVVTQVDLFSMTGAGAFVDQVSVGLGTKFGLTGPLVGASDVLYVNEGGATLTSGFAVDVTATQQGITFVSGPNGVRNYTVTFRAR